MATGCYTPEYLTASFKGVSFKAEEVTSEHGRRGAEGEFPFGEQTGYADLGRRIRTYSLRGRFDANSHVADAASLVAVCESTGPGVLVHPTRGIILSVACKRLRVTDKIETDGGVTYVELDFVEANEWPNGLSITGSLLGLALSPIIAAARLAFTTNYNIARIPTFREAAVVDAAQQQVANVREQYAAATTSMSTNNDRNRVIFDLNSVATVDATATITSNVDKAISLGMAAIAQNLTGTAKFDAMRTLANGAALSSSFAAPASTAEEAIYSLVRTTAAAYMAEATLESTDYRTGQIFTQADIVDTLLEAEMIYARNTCQNQLYVDLAQFRTSAAAQLAERAYNSPGLVEFDYGGQVHPLVAAYDIYGDATRHREIEDLNIIASMGRVGSPVLGALI